MIWISKKSGICLPQVLDLFFLIKELCEQVRDLWSVPHAVSGLAGQADISRQKCRNPMWRDSFRARIYTVFISSKKYSPLHIVCVSCWFSWVSIVKDWISKHSHWLWAGLLWTGWRPNHGSVLSRTYSIHSRIVLMQSYHWDYIHAAKVEGWMIVYKAASRIRLLLWTIESTSIHTEKHRESVGKQHKNL